MRAEVIHGSRLAFYLMQSSCCFFEKFFLHLFLDTGQKLDSFSANVLVAIQLGKHANFFWGGGGGGVRYINMQMLDAENKMLGKVRGFTW